MIAWSLWAVIETEPTHIKMNNDFIKVNYVCYGLIVICIIVVYSSGIVPQIHGKYRVTSVKPCFGLVVK